ncbi:hypothetical protein ACFY2R_03290 [Micromonospora olivasterospora]|uniref:S-DNA-T family DNA segregation ATPase FtsK/SpoIIIE n=1 Tax=Micromonospora olivasterospora TaxID=1880 RepID=A0A562IB20_MICOL|nr:hypothetical protein [Micromonospora olivasterospora]TWH68082.1 S-DNA-T family DNA segregation ATPase FtsK/SpoIIIE [Micromonospora olivasterospora]
MGMVMLVEMGGGMLAMAVFQMTMNNGNRNQRINGDRRDYFRYLSQTRVRSASTRRNSRTRWPGGTPTRSPGPAAAAAARPTRRTWRARPRHGPSGATAAG